MAAVAEVTGRAVLWHAAPRRVGDPPALVADARLAKSLLGFAPQRSDLRTMLQDAARAFGVLGQEVAHA